MQSFSQQAESAKSGDRSALSKCSIYGPAPLASQKCIEHEQNIPPVALPKINIVRRYHAEIIDFS